MQVTYEIKAEDFVAFNLNYMKHDKAAQKRVLLSQLVGAAVILLAAGIFCAMSGRVSLPILGLAVLAAGLYAAYIPWSIKGSVKKSVDRVLKSGSKTACGEKTLAVEEEKLHLTGSGEDSFYDYGSIVRAVMGTAHYFIYTGAMEALILPYRAFEGEADRTRFFSALCDKVLAAGGTL